MTKFYFRYFYIFLDIFIHSLQTAKHITPPTYTKHTLKKHTKQSINPTNKTTNFPNQQSKPKQSNAIQISNASETGKPKPLPMPEHKQKHKSKQGSPNKKQGDSVQGNASPKASRPGENVRGAFPLC